MNFKTQGRRPVSRCDQLGVAPYSIDDSVLTRPYLTGAHKAALDDLRRWMTDAGMSVRIDPVGNMIGRYEGDRPNAPALLIGSHIDSVQDGGRYDGALGIMLGVETVDAFAQAGRRLPFAIEVIAFGDEEGSRFPASMLCSRAIAAGVEPGALEARDEDGVSIAQALTAFGLDPENAAAAQRKPGEILAYVEPHIEQGPVLEAEDLPVGVVTGIAAQLRLKARFTGQAGHAGTSPMGLRRDSVAAAAAAILEVEKIATEGGPYLVGTVGRVIASTSAFNVIAGQTEIGIDLRAASRDVRDAAAAKIRQRVEAIAAERNVGLELSVVQDLPGSPSDETLTELLAEAMNDVGVRPYRLMSGAGHDAMMLSSLCPTTMLFIRCERGISHNPAEKVREDDVGVAVGAMVAFVERLASAQAQLSTAAQ